MFRNLTLAQHPNDLFFRAVGATLGALIAAFCRRDIAKLLEGNKVTGAGDGNRTHRPISAVI